MGWTIVIVAGGVGALAGMFYQAVGAARDRRTYVAPGKLGLAGRHRLHYRCAGTGTPAVVFEAGIAASSLTWSRVQPIIARSTRACSYDRAGLAWSEPAPSPRTMPVLVCELRHLLDSAQVPPPYVLVGHSFGGLVIRAFARAHPKDIAGLVFVDPLHPEEWCDPSPQQRRMLRGGIFLSKVGGLLARLGVVRVCLSLLSRGSPGIPRRFSRLLGRSATALIERMVSEVQKLPPEVTAADSGPLVASQGVPRYVAASRVDAGVLCPGGARRRHVRQRSCGRAFSGRSRCALARGGCQTCARVIQRTSRDLVAQRPLGAPG